MKNNSIQIARAIAALLVVFHHLFIPIFHRDNAYTDYLKHFNFSFIGDYAVYVFFCISGYVMMMSTTKKHKGSISFLSDRILRIYPSYIIWTVIAIALVYIGRVIGYEIVRFKNIPHNVVDMIQVLLLLPSISDHSNYAMTLPTAWSLVYEMYYYVVFALLLKFISVRNIPYALMGIFALSSFVINSNFPQGRYGWVNLWYIIGDYANICFASGALIYNITNNINNPIKYKHLPIAIVLLFAVLLSSNNGSLYQINIIMMSITTFILFLFSDFGSSVLSRCFSYIGDASYSIYITHMLFNLAAWNSWTQYSSLVGAFGISITSIVFGIIAYEFLEKPLTMASRTLKQRVA